MGESPVNYLAVLILGIIPLELPVTEHVQSIELNCYYDDQANLVFSQFIFRELNPYTNKHEIIVWRLTKGSLNVPVDGVFTFFDHSDHILRRVTYDNAYQTWSQVDPELEGRASLPKELRRDLRKPITRLHD